jgi:hypothetical protein
MILQSPELRVARLITKLPSTVNTSSDLNSTKWKQSSSGLEVRSGLEDPEFKFYFSKNYLRRYQEFYYHRIQECFSKTSLVLPLPIYFYAISLKIEFLPAALKL